MQIQRERTEWLAAATAIWLASAPFFSAMAGLAWSAAVVVAHSTRLQEQNTQFLARALRRDFPRQDSGGPDADE